MPQETHNFLINYETTATRAAGEMQQVTSVLREQVQWTETATGAFQQWATTQTEALGRLNMQWREYMRTLVDVGTVRGFGAEALFAGKPIVAPPLDAEARTWTEMMEAVRAGRQAVNPEWQRQLTFGGPGRGFPGAAEELFAGGAATGITTLDEYNRNMGEFTEAQNIATGAQDEFAESTRKSGHWLGNYIQRYLIRYLLVWQGMKAVQVIISDITESHERMTQSIYDLGLATQATDPEMQQYLNTLTDISIQTSMAPSALTGAVMEGGQMGPMAIQLAQITGAEPQEWLQHLAMLRDSYGLTATQIEGMLGRMAAAHANWAVQGKDYFGDYQQALRDTTAEVEDLSAAIERAAVINQPGIWERFGVGAERATILGQQERLFGLRPEAEQQRLLTEFTQTETYRQIAQAIAATGGMGGPVTQWPQFQDWLAEQPERRPIPVRDGRLTIAPTDIGLGPEARDELGIQGFAGRMTAPEAERYEDLIQKWDAYFLEQGRYLEKQTITLVTEIGQPLKEIKGSAEASTMALEEMNERQRNAVYNWPAGAAGVMIGRGAIGDVRLEEEGSRATGGDGGWQPPPGWNPWQIPEDIRVPQWEGGGGGGGGGGVGGGWQPSTIDWNDPFVIPPQYRVGTPGAATQPFSDGGGGGGGGGVGTTPAPWLPMILKTQIDLDGKKVGEGTNQVLGDMYSQASKATYGSGGGLVSAF